MGTYIPFILILVFDHIIFSELRQKIEINFYPILKISGKMQSLLTM